jgi:hypothetical protein
MIPWFTGEYNPDIYGSATYRYIGIEGCVIIQSQSENLINLGLIDFTTKRKR